MVCERLLPSGTICFLSTCGHWYYKPHEYQQGRGQKAPWKKESKATISRLRASERNGSSAQSGHKHWPPRAPKLHLDSPLLPPRATRRRSSGITLENGRSQEESAARDPSEQWDQICATFAQRRASSVAKIKTRLPGRLLSVQGRARYEGDRVQRPKNRRESRSRGKFGVSSSSSNVTSWLRSRSCRRRSQHAGNPELPRASKHPPHVALHGTAATAIQTLLERLRRAAACPKMGRSRGNVNG